MKKDKTKKAQGQLTPVGSTVCYEVMKQCTGSVLDSYGWYLAVLSHSEAVTDVICLEIEKVEIWSGDTDASLTDSQTLKERAT